jgi:hypothetical protein
MDEAKVCGALSRNMDPLDTLPLRASGDSWGVVKMLDHSFFSNHNGQSLPLLPQAVTA